MVALEPVAVPRVAEVVEPFWKHLSSKLAVVAAAVVRKVAELCSYADCLGPQHQMFGHLILSCLQHLYGNQRS